MQDKRKTMFVTTCRRNVHCMQACLKTKLFSVLVLALVLVLAQSGFGGPSLLEEEYRRAAHVSLVGDWMAKVGNTNITLKIGRDGRFELEDTKGLYSVDGSKLNLEADGSRYIYELELADRELTLSGGDLGKSLKFTKLPGTGESKTWLLILSKKSIGSKVRKIAVLVIIVILCRVLLLLLRAAVRFVIYTDRSLLKYVYRHHKSRTMTMYSLILNLSKYIVYFTALGLILTELGINYTAYLASLSVIGLAIGFGSQGLVQDMVTGFFIVFEEQFNVGDMVEIPPHIGIVEELGLRMTKLRNYLGQKVVIPNRNIATVSNYVRGAQQVYIDVAVVGNQTEKTEALLLQLMSQISAQFAEIIISAQDSLDLITLTTGESFLRLQMSIWPQQQWVIEQQLTPRIRATLKQSGDEIPGEKIIVFYHPREKRSVGNRTHVESSSTTIS